jgi:thiosulfate/3-mercaptopyruvate sulfurtransferase
VTPTFGPLIAVEQLAELLAGEPPTLLDVRWQLGGPAGHVLYSEGHVPGAVFVDLDAVLAGPPGAGGRHPLPDEAVFVAGMRAAGVSNQKPVVVYDDASAMAAARAWWLLRYYGHPRVAVLDGGLAAWVAAGHPIDGHEPDPAPGDFEAHPGAMPLLDAAGAGSLPARGGVLLDARAPERFAGETEPIDPVAGHVPGARNFPSTGNVDSRGRFLATEALRDGFAEVGVADGVEVGAYCGSGVVAAHELLALELAGFHGALYVGSWSDWITDPARPIELGR